MKFRQIEIIAGNVRVSDEDNGTTRPTWKATLYGRVAKYGMSYQGKGEGKAPHVALKRAAEQLCEEVKRA